MKQSAQLQQDHYTVLVRESCVHLQGEGILADEICPGDKYFTENFFHEKSFSFSWLLLLLLLYTGNIHLFIDIARTFSFYGWVSLN